MRCRNRPYDPPLSQTLFPSLFTGTPIARSPAIPGGTILGFRPEKHFGILNHVLASFRDTFNPILIDYKKLNTKQK